MDVRNSAGGADIDLESSKKCGGTAVVSAEGSAKKFLLLNFWGWPEGEDSVSSSLGLLLNKFIVRCEGNYTVFNDLFLPRYQN